MLLNSDNGLSQKPQTSKLNGSTTKNKKILPFEQLLKENKYLRSKYEECFLHDLTAENLNYYFPDYNIEDIYEYIKKQPEFIPLAKTITRGEKSLIKELISEKKSFEEILPLFPLRDEQTIRTNYNALVYASGRTPRFKNSLERLIYEQGMAVQVDSSRKRSSRRSTQSDFKIEELDDIQGEARKLDRYLYKTKTTEDVDPVRRELTRKAYQIKLKKKQDRIQKSKDAWARGRVPGGGARPITLHSELRDLNAGLEHFQTVVGDRQKIEEGSKRKRTQAVFFEPSTEPLFKRSKIRQNLKAQARLRIRKEALLKERNKKRKQSRKRKSKSKFTLEDEETPEPRDDDLLETLGEEEEEIYISKFDPPDLNSDTLVPLYDRQLFTESIYGETPQLPALNFRSLEANETIKDAMTSEDDSILYDDELAAQVVGTHIKCYRDLPISFPTHFNKKTIDVNYEQSVKVRFLLYPEHCESYVLAEPKDNELDPVHEIMKLFMIHYALYFSHSEVLKDKINEYCHQLESSIENSDFTEFLYVIDKWNLLMLYLTPNESSASKILKENKDLNHGAREILDNTEIRVPKKEDLDLEIYYNEICYESNSPIFEPVIKTEITDEELIEPKLDISMKNLELPEIKVGPINVEKVYAKPSKFNSDFFKRLTTKESISRYTMQQLLLRVYARVVSTDSRKLRSYKAFTAEVYGELLPSFTSEVLEKVELKPQQKFYDLGSGVGNTTLQAALEFGACISGGCELMEHASYLTNLQENLIQKHLAVLGLKKLNLKFALKQSFVNNLTVQQDCLDSDILIINNYLFDGELNASVGRLLKDLKPGTKIISLRNFISPRYKATFDTVFDRLSVEKHEMSDLMSVSWTANKVPYYISTVEEEIRPEYYKFGGELQSGSTTPSTIQNSTPSTIDDMDIDDHKRFNAFHDDFDDESLRGGESTPPTDQHSDNDNK
ncbi:DOT1 [Candida jiufengensis]|uniref:DOT1 n=1 Tax=Candida jiufengensis TaxID=497108 RepID=UPI0022249C0E|nr:DOT1 [Candida jiufengensis]KAI5952613.1 DOT1 [Candida jiufengensis]